MDARNIGLILSRKEDEQIVINPGQPDEIVCTVVAIEGNRVRLGFLAPRVFIVAKLSRRHPSVIPIPPYG